MGTHIGSLAELRRTGRLLGKVGDRPVMVVHDARQSDDRIYAIEDRCPHLGFPLHRGTIECGMVTCHWHHARFDLASGSTLDPWADDAMAFDVVIDGDAVAVAPRVAGAATERAEQRLREGLEEGLTIVIAKAVLRLMDEPDGVARIVRIGAEFGSRQRAAGWGSGMTVLTCLANVVDRLDPADRPAALIHAMVFLSRDTRGNPTRFVVPPLGPGQSVETLAVWYRRFVETRERDGASRSLATVAEAGDLEALEAMMGGAVTDHVYVDGGHTLDFTNKAFELVGQAGAPGPEVLVSLVRQTCEAERSEETSEWNHPHDLAALVREHEGALVHLLTGRPGPSGCDVGELGESLLDEDPDAVVGALMKAAENGACTEELARAVAYAAALRMLRFNTNNDPGDWDTVHHTFTFANAVHQFAVRGRAPDAVRGILHGALRVNLDRFLNVPPARAPQARAGRLEALAAAWDRQGQVDVAGNELTGFLRGGGTRREAQAALGRAVLEEDAGFHTYQGLEAAIRQSEAWPEGSEESIAVLAAFARFLAAHTPTRRELATVIRTAVRLRRGGNVFEDGE